MKVSTNRGLEISVEDIPNVAKLTSMDVNLQDGTVNFYYEGWKPIAYPSPVIGDEMVTTYPPRYDGELDDPDHPRQIDGPEGAYQTGHRPRPVKDNPQA